MHSKMCDLSLSHCVTLDRSIGPPQEGQIGSTESFGSGVVIKPRCGFSRPRQFGEIRVLFRSLVWRIFGAEVQNALGCGNLVGTLHAAASRMSIAAPGSPAEAVPFLWNGHIFPLPSRRQNPSLC